MMPRPSFALDFTGASGYLDPRITFARTSIGSYADRQGTLRYSPANAPRFWHNSENSGLLGEGGATNFLLWSEAFDNAAWIKTACTVSVNAGIAPDGNNAADSVVATDITASVAQTVTISAGVNLAFSVFAKLNSSAPYLLLTLTSGGLTVPVWFNIASGTVGSSGAGSGNLIFQSATIREWGNGWYRCSVLVNTATITSVTASFAPAVQDSGAAVAGTSVLVWGAMLSQEGTTEVTNRVTTYLATTTVSVTRAQETCNLPYSALDPGLFNTTEGTYFLDFMLPPGANASNTGIAGASNTFVHAITISITTGGSSLTVTGTVIYLTSAQTVVSDTVPFAPDQPVKVAFRGGAGLLAAICVNGRAPVIASIPVISWPWTAATPTSFQWNSWAQGPAVVPIISRRFSYYSRMLTGAQMQQLTG